MTIEEAYNHFVQQLESIYDQREAANIADWVFESVSGLKRVDRLIKKKEEITDERLFDILKELLTHKPVQYVLGEAWFCKMKFRVNEHVLIPRPETEELVENVRMCECVNVRINPGILDIGAGSGCISISLKKIIPQGIVIGIDVSDEALKVARENAVELNADVEFIQLNFLDKNEWGGLGKFDVIVSNPPYIPVNEKAKLDKNVALFEPHLALFVEDHDPLIFYRKIAEFAKGHLNTNGKIFVEVHEDYASEVSAIFKQHSFETEIRKDLYRRNRIVTAG